VPTAPIGSGRIVLLDPAGERVARVVPDPLPESYFDLRRRLAAHVAVAPILERGTDWIVEGLVTGDDFGRSPADAQRDVIRRMFASATELVVAEGRPGPDEQDGALLDVLAGVGADSWLGRLAHGARLDGLLRDSTIVPVHGDLGGHNFVLVEGEPVLFDLDPRQLRWGPFWYDVAHWLHPLIDLPQRHWFRAGEFDEEVLRLCIAGGWQAERPVILRERITALIAAARTLRDDPRAREPDRFAAAVDLIGDRMGLT